MNSEQARHLKSVARHIQEHAQTLVVRMEAVQCDNLETIPDAVFEPLWKEVRRECREIEQVLRDMLPSINPAS